MTSARKIESNRANSKRSTGPKSATGKSRAAQNARRHGLSVPVEADQLLAEQVMALAQVIADEFGESELTEIAAPIAEAEVDLLRIRQMANTVFGNRLGDRLRFSTVTNNSQREANRLADRSQTFGERELAKELLVLDRYRRRVLSRRKFAIRAFDLACQQAREGAGPPLAAAIQKSRRR